MPKRKSTPARTRYGPHTPAVECDTRDGKLRNGKDWEETAAQRRFLDAYAERPVIASAAKLAGVARCTVYRWLASIPAFEKALRDAAERAGRKARERWEVWAAERKRWREERERARRPMRCANLAKARAAYKEALRRRGGRKRAPWTY